jgi:hypothetical protein
MLILPILKFSLWHASYTEESVCVGGASFRSGPEKGDKLQIRTGNWGGQLSKLTSKNIIWLHMYKCTRR